MAELIELLQTMPESAQVMLVTGECSSVFLQPERVLRVAGLGGLETVLLGAQARIPSRMD